MTGPVVIDCQQNSPEWFRARLGLPTASKFAVVMARTPKGNAYGKTRDEYMRKLAGEVVTGEPAYSYRNADMERGHEHEGEARALYGLRSAEEPVLVGFMRNGAKGASPDSLVGDNGLLEIKSALAHIQIDRMLRDRLPPEFKAQVQGQLWVAEREWCDFVSYWPGLPLFEHRAYRDEPYIRTLEMEVNRFNEDLAEMVERVRGYAGRAAA